MARKPESAWVIPGDWVLGVGSWVGYCIQWPDSPEWELQLRSMLFTLTMGREWDRDSGVIKDAQAIGWEIFDRNHPFNACGVDPTSPPVVYVDRVVYRGGSVTDEGEIGNMGQVVTDVTVNELGQIVVWFGPCCPKVLEGVTTVSSPENVGDEPLNPDNEPEYENDPCGMAYAAVQEWLAVAQSAWDTAAGTDFDYPSWTVALANLHPELHGGLQPWLSTVLQAQTIQNTFELVFADVAPPYFIQELTCRLRDHFVSPLTVELGGVSYEQPVSGVFKQAVLEFFDTEVHSYYLFVRNFWNGVEKTVGDGDIKNIYLAGGRDTTRDCGCPDPNELRLFDGYAVQANWRYVFDLRNSLPSYIELDTDTIQAIGQGLWSDCGPTQNNNEVGFKVHLDQVNNGSVVTNIGILYKTRGDEDYNNSSGCSVKVEDTEHISVTDMEVSSGTTPAQAGTWTITKTVNDPLGAAEDVFDAGIAVYHAGAQLDDVIENSVVIIALFVAGTGPGPLSNPPV